MAGPTDIQTAWRSFLGEQHQGIYNLIKDKVKLLPVDLIADEDDWKSIFDELGLHGQDRLIVKNLLRAQKGPLGSPHTEVAATELELVILVGSEAPSQITAYTSDTVETLRTKVCERLQLQQRQRWVVLELLSGPRILSMNKSLSEEYLTSGEILRVGFIAPDVVVEQYNEGLTMEQVVTYASEEKLTEYMDNYTGFVQMKEAKGNDSHFISTFSEDLCALANFVTTRFYTHGTYKPGYVILGLCDNGKHAGPTWTYEKAIAKEPTIANEIRKHLVPCNTIKVTPALLRLSSKEPAGIIIISVYPAPMISFWDGKPYQQSGTSSHEMTENDTTTWLKKFPVVDFSAIHWNGDVNASLVMAFGNGLTLPSLNTQSADDILRYVNIKGMMASRILFGDITATINFYAKDGTPRFSREYTGLFHFITQGQKDINQESYEPRLNITNGTRRVSLPYHPLVLREALVNSVIHCNYGVGVLGYPVVDVHADYFVVRNAAVLALAEVTQRGWFSSRHFAENHRLATCLRSAKTAEVIESPTWVELQGFGKQVMMRYSMMGYKLAPNVDVFREPYPVWQLTVHDGVADDEEFAIFEDILKLLPAIRSKDSAVSPDVALVMLAYRGASQNRFFEALSTEQREQAKVLRNKELAPCNIENGMLMPVPLVVLQTTYRNYLKELELQYYMPKNRNDQGFQRTNK